MKLKYFSSLALGALSFFVGACDDAEYSEIENGVYIAEASPMDNYVQQVELQMVDEANVNRTFTVRMQRPASQDVQVKLEFDATMIDAYNAKNSTAYQMLPAKYIDMPQMETVIAAGQVSAPSLTMSIKPFTTPNQEQYAIPVRISSVVGAQATGNGNKLLLLLSSPLKQKSVVLNGRNSHTLKFKGDIAAPTWSFEFWLKVNNKTGMPTEPWFGTAAGDPNRPKRAQIFGDNSAPIHLDGTESVLLRYWADGVKKTGPTLQCQLNGPYMDSSEFWYPDTWYHIVYTYDGKTLTLYKDGEVDVTKEVSKDFIFKSLSFCSSFGWKMEIELTQIRLWNKALTKNAIKDGMSRQLPGNSDGLVGYWPCDEGKGTVLKDHTSNGNDIDFGNKKPSWSDTVYNFAHPNDK
ncbi:secreted protein containing Region of unknown function DUF1735 [gut metagenome]|uniref:BT-3987-like N-terminal domain-containing protein n=1 Tax=gut metagenome TaxID=749906 RepID=J9GQK8_9ZZZZ